MMANNPSVLRELDSPGRSQAQVHNLNERVTERKKETSILLDKDERELVKRGEEVTKEEMW